MVVFSFHETGQCKAPANRQVFWTSLSDRRSGARLSAVHFAGLRAAVGGGRWREKHGGTKGPGRLGALTRRRNGGEAVQYIELADELGGGGDEGLRVSFVDSNSLKFEGIGRSNDCDRFQPIQMFSVSIDVGAHNTCRSCIDLFSITTLIDLYLLYVNLLPSKTITVFAELATVVQSARRPTSNTAALRPSLIGAPRRAPDVASTPRRRRP